MGLWHELVCNECSDSYIGVSTFNNDRVKAMIKSAKTDGWKVNSLTKLVLCPDCKKKMEE